MGEENILAAPATTLIDSVSLGLSKGDSVFSKEAEPVSVEDVAQNVGQILLANAPMASEKFSYKTTIYELSLANLSKIMGDALDAGILKGGGTETVASHELTIYTIAPSGKTRKITIYKGVITGPREYNMQRGEPSAIALEFTCTPDLTKDAGKQVYEIEDTVDDYSLTTGLS